MQVLPSPVTPGGVSTWSMLPPPRGGEESQSSHLRLGWWPLASAWPGHCYLASPSSPSHPTLSCQPHFTSLLPPLQAPCYAHRCVLILFRCWFLCKPSLDLWHRSLLPRGFSEIGSIKRRCSGLRNVFAMPSAEPPMVLILYNYLRAQEFAS